MDVVGPKVQDAEPSKERACLIRLVILGCGYRFYMDFPLYELLRLECNLWRNIAI